MRSLQKSFDQLSARGVRVVAISVDPSEVTRQHAAKQGYTFTFLSDAKAEVIRRYDLLHPGGGPQSEEISLSGEFLLDTTGTVRWANVEQGPKARPTGKTILQVLDQLARSPSR